jgi:hypothetical protein
MRPELSCACMLKKYAALLARANLMQCDISASPFDVL